MIDFLIWWTVCFVCFRTGYLFGVLERKNAKDKLPLISKSHGYLDGHWYFLVDKNTGKELGYYVWYEKDKCFTANSSGIYLPHEVTVFDAKNKKATSS